jgi:isochorismate synthase
MDVSCFLFEELKTIDLKIEQSPTTSFIKCEFGSIDLLKLLRHSATERVVYYESKDEDFSYLGLGVAKKFKTSEILATLNENHNTPLFMQGTFEESIENYLSIQFEWTFVKKGQTTTLTIHQNSDNTYSPSSKFFNTEVWESFVSPWESYEESPEHDEWNSWIENAQDLFNRGTIEKIVLSRKKIFSYEDPIDSLFLFQELYHANKNSSHFTLYNQENAQNVFISFTPEKLFSLKGHIVETLSLAGSMPRGETPDQDAENYLNLQNSTKLIHEQSSVTSEIKTLLEKVCDKVEVSELKVMKLPYIFHRQRDITGTLMSDVDALDLVRLMHPTPAVGGFPRELVGPHILNIEKNKRNYYAAPFGILSKDFSEFAVGIRSAKIEDESITVFGGAGIVNGSIAEDEWSETGTKMKPFLKVINQSL